MNSTNRFVFLLAFICVSIYSCKTQSQTTSTGHEETSGTVLNNSTNIAFDKGTNVILILADDVGYEIPGFTGGQSYSTPNLDLMAKSGMQFSRCYASPSCSPSRAMLLTGKYNFRNYNGWGEIDENEKTIATLAKDAGYETCMAGKWQMNGNAQFPSALGFKHYLRANAMSEQRAEQGKPGYYKYPAVFESGAYWPDNKINGRYGQDLFRDYVFDFIDEYKSKKPFFVYWAMNLPHKPFAPTPDDAAYGNWPKARGYEPGDTIYFPSMIKYMDKMIGQLIDKLKADNILDKTVIIFAGDNGTDRKSSLWNGQIIKGRKSETNEYGTHVPLLVYGPGKINAGIKDGSLIDFTDLMPTLADIFAVQLSKDYFTDGKSFAPRLKGLTGDPRSWIFCSYQPFPDKPNSKIRRWIQDSVYKKYDDNMVGNGNFYNILRDPLERFPIAKSQMTPNEKQIDEQFSASFKKLQ